jgi:hypothetical protein
MDVLLKVTFEDAGTRERSDKEVALPGGGKLTYLPAPITRCSRRILVSGGVLKCIQESEEQGQLGDSLIEVFVIKEGVLLQTTHDCGRRGSET